MRIVSLARGLGIAVGLMVAKEIIRDELNTVQLLKLTDE